MEQVAGSCWPEKRPSWTAVDYRLGGAAEETMGPQIQRAHCQSRAVEEASEYPECFPSH